jgi:hypothetical protein
VVTIYGLSEHAKPVLMAPQRPETTSVNGTGALPIALRQTQFASHSDSLDSELSNPSNEAGGVSGLRRGRSRIGGPSTVQTASAKMCAFRAESEVCSREAGIAQTRSDMV